MPSRTAKRQPLSCENCRARKIKCSGNRVPCESCVRRGFASSCQYLREQIAVPSQSLRYDELLERMSKLEELLTQQNSNPAVTPPQQQDTPGPRSWTESTDYGASQEIANFAGTLIVSPTGHVRYVPGTYLPDAGAVEQLLGSPASQDLATAFPFASDAVVSRQMLLELLPPIRQCEELKSVFFEVFSPLFHVLHEPTFDAIYEEFRRNPHETPLAFVSLLFVMLAVAVTALDESHHLLEDLGRESSASANIKTVAARYRSAAMRCLSADQFMWQHNLYTVQTLLLLIYALNHANGPSWALLGTTFNIAVAIGCHIDPSELDLNPVESEERRRCWAALMMLYTIQNTCLGNLAPQKITANVRMPADRDDEDITDTGIIPYPHLHEARRALTKMTYIIYKFRLYEIAAKICLSPIATQRLNKTAILALDSQIAAEEEEQKNRFYDLDQLPTYHVAHHYILKNYTNHLYLILHRPHLNVDVAGTGASTLYDEGLQHSRKRCHSAAMTILDCHERLYRSQSLKPYRWYIHGLGSFHAFLAASTLIVLSASHGSPSSHLNSPGSDSQTLHVLQSCLVRFEEMAPRSEVCTKAASILQYLLQHCTAPNGNDISLTARPGSNQSTANVQANWQKSNATMSSSNLHTFNDSQHQNLHQYSALPSPPLHEFGCGTHSVMENQTGNMSNNNNVDNWLTANSQLEALMSQLAPEQWLTPSAFPWERWGMTISDFGAV